jgi:hypothetical protein
MFTAAVTSQSITSRKPKINPMDFGGVKFERLGFRARPTEAKPKMIKPIQKTRVFSPSNMNHHILL